MFATQEEVDVLSEETVVNVQLARIEQRLTDHEIHDEHFRKMAMWVSGFVITILVAVIGTVWSNLNEMQGGQKVVISTIVDIRQQLGEIKDSQKILQDTLVRFQIENRNR